MPIDSSNIARNIVITIAHIVLCNYRLLEDTKVVSIKSTTYDKKMAPFKYSFEILKLYYKLKACQ